MAHLITGVIFIVLGFLVVRFPMLIAGYNTMPKEQREKVDIHGLSRFMRNVFCVMGAILIVAPFLLNMIGLSKWNETLILVMIFGGTGFLFIKGRTYSKGTSKGLSKASLTQEKIGAWLAIIISVGVFGSCFYVGMPAKIAIHENELVISGAYSVTIPTETITNVEVRDQQPSTEMRTNGLSFMSYHKGHFQVKEIGGGCLFYLHSGKGPYLIVFSKDNPPVVINRSTAEEIQQLYNQLHTQVAEKPQHKSVWKFSSPTQSSVSF